MLLKSPTKPGKYKQLGDGDLERREAAASLNSDQTQSSSSASGRKLFGSAVEEETAAAKNLEPRRSSESLRKS